MRININNRCKWFHTPPTTLPLLVKSHIKLIKKTMKLILFTKRSFRVFILSLFILNFLTISLTIDQVQANPLLNKSSTIKNQKPLSGIKIVINPGHGGRETGAVGPTGYLAKNANLQVSKLLAAELRKQGAIIIMTREDDRDLTLSDRQAIIYREQPAIAITIHYTFAEDYQNAETTKGIRAFWYHPQSHNLAISIHNYLIRKLRRESGGVFWNNLALTRPEIAPSIVLELGFFSNPEEFEWITNSKEQTKLAIALAESIIQWFQQTQKN